LLGLQVYPFLTGLYTKRWTPLVSKSEGTKYRVSGKDQLNTVIIKTDKRLLDRFTASHPLPELLSERDFPTKDRRKQQERE
jgi:hypothetical protein